jgi:exo-beta-1,3-glucanase (GH17 family)
LHCLPGEITKHTPESFFMLKAVSTIVPLTTVEAQIKVTFVEKLVFQPDTVCDVLGCADVRYYDTWKTLPDAEQLVRFRIRGVQQHSVLQVHDTYVTSPGFPTEGHSGACNVRV